MTVATAVAHFAGEAEIPNFGPNSIHNKNAGNAIVVLYEKYISTE